MEKNNLVEKVADLGKVDEEFDNFMYKVDEVNKIVKMLASRNEEIRNQGDSEAKKYLGEDRQTVLENLDNENVILRVSANRTLINKKAIAREDNKNANKMSKDAFMDEVSKDADRRYKDKLVRKEKMETLKKQATLAFRRQEYEKALVLFNKAIEQIKDSPTLYNNRALTFIKLGLYDKAKDDLRDWALRLNEDCLKTWLLLAKAHFLSGEMEQFEECVLEAKARKPDQVKFIEEYVEGVRADPKG